MTLQTKSKCAYRWECSACTNAKPTPKGSNKGIRVYNFLRNSRLPVLSIVKFLRLWADSQTTIKYTMMELNIDKNTVVEWNGYVRQVCGWKVANLLKQPIGGPGMTVEIDESLLAKRKNHKGRMLPEKWLFGGVCRETHAKFAVLVPDRTSATLIPHIEAFIAPGSKIISDGWRSYQQLAVHPSYTFNWVNHSTNFVKVGDTKVHTQTIESMWRPYKDANRRRNGTHDTMMGSYVAEGLWRAALPPGKAVFEAILEDIAAFWPPGSHIDSLLFFK